MAKIIKTYESFMSQGKYKFEENVIDPILILIRDNQEYLKDNLPQLAKLGYMYNTLWYAGRVCWGSDGLLLADSIKKSESDDKWDWVSCEENPKYKIDMCNPIDDDMENFIYDAWAMHVREEDQDSPPNFEKFKKIIQEGQPLSELDKKLLKVNKTMEDWVEIKTDPNYRYKSLYPNRRSVINNLLCTIGTGYSMNKNGFIIEEAGGADQDKSLYGDWKNAKFSNEIKTEVDRILSIPEVKLTLDTYHDYITESSRKRKEKENSWMSKLASLGKREEGEDSELDDLVSKIMASLGKGGSKTKEEYSKYYPISSSSTIYIIGDDESKKRLGITHVDDSYIKASIEICKDILAHQDKEEEGNISFAKKFLYKQGYKEYGKDVPKEVDKYAILEDVIDAFIYVTDHFQNIDARVRLNPEQYRLYLNDTKNDSYADNNYYFSLGIDNSFPKGSSTNPDILKSTKYYDDFMSTLKSLREIEEIKNIMFYYDNVDEYSREIRIEMYVHDKYNYQPDIKKFNDDLIKEGFQVGYNKINLELNNVILTTGRPKPLGSKHPHTKTGKEIFSTSHRFEVRNKSWGVIADFNIDERGFNTLSLVNSSSIEISKWVMDEFKKMKASNPKYGTYDSENRDSRKEGKEGLYAHDFFLWLKQHQK
jgi:hypothetical protein